jgi:hypothetical protein
MLTIEWIRRRGHDEPPAVVETMPSRQSVVADAVEIAKAQFEATRERLPLNPPDGFRIVDESDKELAEWFATGDLPA